MIRWHDCLQHPPLSEDNVEVAQHIGSVDSEQEENRLGNVYLEREGAISSSGHNAGSLCCKSCGHTCHTYTTHNAGSLCCQSCGHTFHTYTYTLFTHTPHLSHIHHTGDTPKGGGIGVVLVARYGHACHTQAVPSHLQW